jgi:hypothetical protein
MNARHALPVLALLAVLAAACAGGSSQPPGDGGGDGGQADGSSAPAPSSDPTAVELYILGSGDQGPALVRRVVASGDETVVADLEEGGQIEVFGDDVWLSNRSTLIHVDPATGTATTISLPDSGAYIGGNDEQVWVVVGIGGVADTIVGIDAATNEIVQTVKAPAPIQDVAVGDGVVWTEGGDPGFVNRVTRIDPATGAATVHDAVVIPAGMAVDGEALWIAGTKPAADAASQPVEAVVKVAADGSVAATYELPDAGALSDIAVGYDGVWVSDGRSGDLLRLDPDSGAVVATIDIGEGGEGAGQFRVDLARGTVWVTNPAERKAFAVSPATNDWDQGIDVASGTFGFVP